jgi:RHS repeat-associated protein
LTKVTRRNDQDEITHEMEFTYDVFDRRIRTDESTVSGGVYATQTTKFLYDGNHIALVYVSPSDMLAHRYLFGPAVDQVLADEAFELNQPQGVRWPLTDHLGTVRDVVDSSGTVVNHITYTSFGVPLDETDPSAHIAFGYTGREFEAEIGLQFNRARWYDPVLGVWVSVDPIGFAGGLANLYGYVGNDVLSDTDPNGEKGIGHHWMPVSVVQDLYKTGQITRDAYLVGLGAYSGFLGEKHNWGSVYDGVSHPQYNDRVKELMKDYLKERKIVGKIDDREMTRIVDALKDGKHPRFPNGTPDDTLKRFNSKAKELRSAWVSAGKNRGSRALECCETFKSRGSQFLEAVKRIKANKLAQKAALAAAKVAKGLLPVAEKTLGRKVGNAAKKLAKATPLLGFFFFAQDVRAKGWGGGIANTAMDNIPFYGWFKAGAEIWTGEDSVPDLDDPRAASNRLREVTEEDLTDEDFMIAALEDPEYQERVDRMMRILSRDMPCASPRPQPFGTPTDDDATIEFFRRLKDRCR